MTPDAIVAVARAQLGTPFRHQGRLPGIALDCAGLVVVVADQLGLPHADQTGYARQPSGGRLEAALASQPGLVRIDGEPQAGDVLLMRFSGMPQHLGICTDDTLIHAWEAAGKVVEHRLDTVWRRRIVAVYRFIEVSA